MFKRILFVGLLIAVLSGQMATAGVTEVFISSDRTAPGVNPILVSFNCDDPAAVKFQVYYASPFDPDTWEPYKGAFPWWAVINEPGSPHHYTVNIKYCHPKWIGVARIAVSSTDASGVESNLVEGSWETLTEKVRLRHGPSN